MVQAIGCSSERGNGNDALEVYQKVSSAITSIRRGEGPHFFEFATYRWREHCGPNFDNDIGYRTQEEYLSWRERDPIPSLESALLSGKFVSEKDVESMEVSIQREINEAFAYAETSPFPKPEEAFTDLYKT